MILLPNVAINTSRAVYTTSKGSKPTAKLTGVVGHLDPGHMADWIQTPMGAEQTDLKIKVEVGTDIAQNDTITAIMKTNGTPYLTPSSKEVFTVVNVEANSPGFLESLVVSVRRELTGGKAS